MKAREPVRNHHVCQTVGSTSNATAASDSFHNPSLLEAITRKRYECAPRFVYTASRVATGSLQERSKPSRKYRKRTRSGSAKLRPVYMKVILRGEAGI